MGAYRCLECGAEFEELAELREHLGERLGCAAGTMLELFNTDRQATLRWLLWSDPALDLAVQIANQINAADFSGVVT